MLELEGVEKPGKKEDPSPLKRDAPRDPDTDMVCLRSFLLARAEDASPESESESESLAARSSSGGSELADD